MIRDYIDQSDTIQFTFSDNFYKFDFVKRSRGDLWNVDMIIYDTSQSIEKPEITTDDLEDFIRNRMNKYDYFLIFRKNKSIIKFLIEV